MLIKSLFAGFGGQGVLLMGYIFAHAAMNEDRHVTFMPSYGAEMRGGTANCTVAVSNDEIASPIASSPENLVVMNEPSLAHFQSSVKTGGLVMVNSTLVLREVTRSEVSVVNVPATKIAEDLGDIRAANIVMLGAFTVATGLVSTRTLGASLEEVFGARKKAILELNMKALQLGMDCIRDNYPERFKKKAKHGAAV